MAELILTEEEKNAEYWADLDDEALGRVVKKMLLQIREMRKEYYDEGNALRWSCAVIMMGVDAMECNADSSRMVVDGLTYQNIPIGTGSYEIELRMLPRPQYTWWDKVKHAVYRWTHKDSVRKVEVRFWK